MLGHATTKVLGLLLIAISLCLVLLVSQFRGTNLLGQLSGYRENQQNTLGVALGTLDHPYLTHVNVSVKDGNVLTDLISPTILYVDMDMSFNTTNQLILDHVRDCYPHLDDGTRLPFTRNNDDYERQFMESGNGLVVKDSATGANPSFAPVEVMNINEISDSHVWLLDLRPHEHRYWVKCELEFEAGALNYTLFRRRLNVLNLQANDMIDRVKLFKHFDSETMEGFVLSDYVDKVYRFKNPNYGQAFPRNISVKSNIENAASVEIDDGAIGNDDGSDVDHNPKTTLQWDDLRYAQVRDILYLVIPSLLGLGIALLLRKQRIPHRKPQADFSGS